MESMSTMVIEICRYLETRYEGKKHGGYLIYEDDKVELSYDTYYPNCDVYVKTNGEKHHVFGHSGHGHDYIRRPGAWENYIEELYKKVPEAKELKKKEELERQRKENKEKFGCAPDKLNDVFYNR